MAAASGGHVRMAQHLHSAKADIHAVSRDGWDCLMFAAHQGSYPTIKVCTELIRLSRSRPHFNAILTPVQRRFHAVFKSF